MRTALSLTFLNLTFAIFTLVATALRPDAAHAGTITLSWTPEVTVSNGAEGGKVTVSGLIKIRNSGDEAAEGLFPQLSIGGWNWAGDQRTIGAGAELSWVVDATLAQTELGCEKDSACAGLQLPVKGIFPGFLLIFYQDINGYKFSSADIIQLQVGELNNEQRAALGLREITPIISVDGNGQRFTAEVRIKNDSRSPKKVALSAFTARELGIETKPSVVTIEPQQVKSADIEVANFSGLPGNSYFVHVVLEWEEQGARGYVSAHQVVALKVPDNKRTIFFIMGAIALISVSLIVFVLYLLVRKKASN